MLDVILLNQYTQYNPKQKIDTFKTKHIGILKHAISSFQNQHVLNIQEHDHTLILHHTLAIITVPDYNKSLNFIIVNKQQSTYHELPNNNRRPLNHHHMHTSTKDNITHPINI